MKRSRMAWRVLCGLVLVAALGVGTVVSAASDAQAPEILNDQQEIQGTLVGNPAGAFAYYGVHYPGGDAEASIELWFVPADPVTKLGFGFNVWRADGTLVGRGSESSNVGGAGMLSLSYGSADPTVLLVQVYNYVENHPVSYGIVAQGASTPASSAAVASAEQPAQATVPSVSSSLSESGTLVGSAAGAFAHWGITVATDSQDVMVTLNWTPDDPIVSTGVGVMVYGPSGQAAKGEPTGTPGQRSVTLPASIPGVYDVMIYNYIEGLQIHYTIAGAPAS